MKFNDFDLDEVFASLDANLNQPSNPKREVNNIVLPEESLFVKAENNEIDFYKDLYSMASDQLKKMYGDSEVVHDAHPEGSHKLEGLADEEAVVEDLADRQKKMLEVANKQVKAASLNSNFPLSKTQLSKYAFTAPLSVPGIMPGRSAEDVVRDEKRAAEREAFKQKNNYVNEIYKKYKAVLDEHTQLSKTQPNSPKLNELKLQIKELANKYLDARDGKDGAATGLPSPPSSKDIANKRTPVPKVKSEHQDQMRNIQMVLKNLGFPLIVPNGKVGDEATWKAVESLGLKAPDHFKTYKELYKLLDKMAMDRINKDMSYTGNSTTSAPQAAPTTVEVQPQSRDVLLPGRSVTK